MSNSKLVSFVRRTSNKNSPRNHKIDRITIHHMAGNLTLASCCSAVESRGGSCNYCIDSNGKIGLMVDECDRSWCSSSPENDNRAVTIEVANCKGEPNWEISDKAMKSLIALCVDICRRNGIRRLCYTGDTSGNMTMHKWFAPTGCPGPYLSEKFGYIASEVNKQLGTQVGTSTDKKSGNKPYLVKVTADVLNVRIGAGTQHPIARTVKRGEVYTIVEVKGNWGRLKSGVGWVCLDYVVKV